MKKRVVLYTAVSVDGFIADSGGGLKWIQGHAKRASESILYGSFLEGIDIVAMEHKTYDKIVTEFSPGKWPYEDKKCYVFSDSSADEVEHAEIVKKSPTDFIKGLSSGNIWVLSGAKTINELIKSNAINEYMITVVPVILGSGIRLFESGNPPIRLYLENTVSDNGFITAHYFTD